MASALTLRFALLWACVVCLLFATLPARAQGEDAGPPAPAVPDIVPPVAISAGSVPYPGGGTGEGEEIIRVGGGMVLVEAMRAGKSPQEACELAIARVNAIALRRGVPPARVAFIALDPQGRTGAACTKGGRFDYAVGREGKSELHAAKEVAPLG